TIPLGACGSDSGSKIGGSSPPSGVYEATNERPGMVTDAGGSSVARSSRGTGTWLWRTRMPPQSIGSSMLPALSETARNSGPGTAAHGPTVSQQSLAKSLGGGSAVKLANGVAGSL